MKLENLIEGLLILQRCSSSGYNVGAEHDVIYIYPTDTPVEGDDLEKLYELGWSQEEVEDGKYDPKESWVAYV